MLKEKAIQNLKQIKLTDGACSLLFQIYDNLKDIEKKHYYFPEQIDAIRSCTEKLKREIPCYETEIVNNQFEMFEVAPPSQDDFYEKHLEFL